MKRSKWMTGSSLLLAGIATLLLSGCLTMSGEPAPTVVQGAGHDEPTADGFLSTKVAPGQSGSCRSSPCTIYYRTPDLGHPVEVVVNNFIVGTFPSGKVVRLGDYNAPNTVISIKGGGAPDAYVNLPGNSL